MALSAEIALRNALEAAQHARKQSAEAQERERLWTWKFMHEARRQNMSWERVGEMLEISGNAAKGYYERNRTRVNAA